MREPRRVPDAATSVFAVVGVVLAVLFALAGLAVIGVAVLMVGAMSHYGSNK